MSNITIPAAAYYRASTGKQELSIHDQQQFVRKWASERGYSLTPENEYVDEGISGTTFEKRPGFMKLLNDIRTNRIQVECVVFYDLSRFSRAADTRQSLSYEWQLEQYGVKVESAKENLSSVPEDFRPLWETMIHVQNSQYSKKLSELVVRGGLSFASRGFNPGGYPPFGYARGMYTLEGKFIRALADDEHKAIKELHIKWIPGDPQKVEIVRRIFRLADCGYGGKAICNVFNREGIKSPRDGLWGVDTVTQMLKNEAYIGIKSWGKSRHAEKAQERVTCPNAHESIIEKEIFYRVQKRLAKRHSCGGGIHTLYLLTGIIKCADCGYSFQGKKKANTKGAVNYYYEDGGYVNSGVCSSQLIPKDALEAFAIENIQELLSKPDYKKQIRQRLGQMLSHHAQAQPDIKKSLSEKLSLLNNGIKVIIEELVKFRSDALRQHLQEKEREKASLEAELRKMNDAESATKAFTDHDHVDAILKKHISNLADLMRKQDARQQKSAIACFLHHAEVRRQESVVRFYFYKVPEPVATDFGVEEPSGTTGFRPLAR